MSIAKKIQLKDDEKIIAVVQPYWFVFLGKYLLGFAFLVASSFYMFRLFFYGWWGYIVYGLGMFLGVYTITRAWLMSRLNVLVITNARAVDIHRLGWFDEIISSVSYLDIKDVVVRKKGIGQSLFNYGGLSIQTKSQQFVLEILDIHNPLEVQLLLVDVGQQYRQDIKVVNTHVIYNNFVKIVPDLTDGELKEARRLIDEQLGGADVV